MMYENQVALAQNYSDAHERITDDELLEIPPTYLNIVPPYRHPGSKCGMSGTEYFRDSIGVAMDDMNEEDKISLEIFLSSLSDKERSDLDKMNEADRREVLITASSRDRELARAMLGLQTSINENPAPRAAALVHAQKTRKLIEKGFRPVQQSLPVIAPYPHDITRQSPFFIESSTGGRTIKQRDVLDNLVIGAGSWGELELFGPRLFTRDEKILLIVFSQVAKQISEGKKDPYEVTGVIKELLEEVGMPATGFYYKLLRDSLENLGKVTFKLTGTLAGGKNKKRSIDPLRQYYFVKADMDTNGDDDVSTYSIRVDPRFFETFVGEFHLYANIDVKVFCSLPPVAGAIYRFFNSHRSTNGRKAFSMLLIAKVINLIVDEDWPPGADMSRWPDAIAKKYKKKSILAAIKKLNEVGIFHNAFIKSGAKGEDDVVVAPDPVERKKILTRSK
jgi:hypothetical protein